MTERHQANRHIAGPHGFTPTHFRRPNIRTAPTSATRRRNEAQ